MVAGERIMHPLALLFSLGALGTLTAPGPAFQKGGPPPAITASCDPGSVSIQGGPAGSGRVAASNPIAWALQRAGPGSRIELAPGAYPPFRIGGNNSSSDNARTGGGLPGRPIVIEGKGGPGSVVIRGSGGDTISITQQIPNGFITFRNLTIEVTGRAGVMFMKGGAHRGFVFEDCDVLGGFDHAKGVGPNSKWGVYANGLVDFEFRGRKRRARVEGTRIEHGFYLQNSSGGVLIERVDAARLGRCFVQFTSRSGDGPPGKGPITIRDCAISDCGLASGDNFKGGFGITFGGRHLGPIVVERTTYRAGFDPSLVHLHGAGEPYGTGALVCVDGGEQEWNESLVLRDVDFRMAPGCGERPTVSIGGVKQFRIEGASVIEGGAFGIALALDAIRPDTKAPWSKPIGDFRVHETVQFLGGVEIKGNRLSAEDRERLGFNGTDSAAPPASSPSPESGG